MNQVIRYLLNELTLVNNQICEYLTSLESTTNFIYQYLLISINFAFYDWILFRKKRILFPETKLHLSVLLYVCIS